MKEKNHNLTIANKSLKKWRSSNIWEQQLQIKLASAKKLRAD